MSLRTGFDPVLALTCATRQRQVAKDGKIEESSMHWRKGMATKGRGKTDAIVTEAEKGIGVPPIPFGGPVLFVR